jgi:PAS domain S-box-containing protein
MLKASPKSLVFLAFIIMLGVFIGFFAWVSFDLKKVVSHSKSERAVLYNLTCLDKLNTSITYIERNQKPYLIQRNNTNHIVRIEKGYQIANEALKELKNSCGNQFLACSEVSILDSLMKEKRKASNKIIALSQNKQPELALDLINSKADSLLIESFIFQYNKLYKNQRDQLLKVQFLHQQQNENANMLLGLIAVITIIFFGFSMWWLLMQITQKDTLLQENQFYIETINNNNAAIKELQLQEHQLAQSLQQNNDLLEGKVNNQTQLIFDVFERIKQVYIGTDSNLNIVYANGKVEDLFGVDSQKLMGKPILDFLFPLAGNPLTNLLKDNRALIGKSNLEFIHPQNGKWYDASIYYAEDGISMIIRNINKNKLDELDLLKSRQMYEFISKANEIILHAKRADDLFSQICELSVSYSDIQFTWIGVPDEITHIVKPIIWAGKGADYLTAIKHITTTDVPTGRGPSGKAIREGIHYYCNDIEHDPDMEIWRDEALSRGFKSSIALPIKTNGKVVTLLTMYATKAFYFTTEQIGLLLNVSENISFALQTFHNDGQRKISELQLLKLSQAIEQSSASVVISDLKGKIEYVNPAFCNLTGYSMDEAIGQNPRILKTGRTSEFEYLQLWQTLTDKKPWHGEFCNKKKNGDLYWEYAVISPILNHNGEVSNYVAVKENITERKKLQEEQQKLTVDILQRNKDLEQFSYMLSHNIRGPLTNILGLIAAVRGGLIKSEEEIIMDGISKSANSMDQVIKDVTEILQLRKFSVESKEELDLSLIVDTIKKNLFYLISEKEASIEIDFTEVNSLFNIKTYLENIFYHLILNGLKFSKPGQSPKIKIWSEKDNDICLIHVRDEGIGIDLIKHREHLFRLYKKLNLHIEGRGVGLFMVKTQVEFMGGDIQVYSELGFWTEFVISLPLKLGN